MRLRRRLVPAAAAAALVAAAVAVVHGAPAGAVAGCAPVPSFDDTVPLPAGPPAAVTVSDGTVEWAVLGADRALYSAGYEIRYDTLGVTELACLGGAAVDAPAVAEYGGGLAYLVLGPNGRIYQRYLTDATPFPGTAWSALPTGLSTAGPAAVTGADGSLHVFVRGTNGRLYHASRSAAGGPWSAFESLGGGIAGAPAVARRPGGGFLAVVRAPNNTIWSIAGSTGAWGRWTQLAGATSASPALGAGYADGRLDLVVTGTTGGLYHSVWTAGAFSPFRRFDTMEPAGTRLAAAGSSGVLILFLTLPGGGANSGYSLLVGDLWRGFAYGPYLCADCLPGAGPAGPAGPAQDRPGGLPGTLRAAATRPR